MRVWGGGGGGGREGGEGRGGRFLPQPNRMAIRNRVQLPRRALCKPVPHAMAPSLALAVTAEGEKIGEREREKEERGAPPKSEDQTEKSQEKAGQDRAGAGGCTSGENHGRGGTGGRKGEWQRGGEESRRPETAKDRGGTIHEAQGEDRAPVDHQTPSFTGRSAM